MKEHCCLQSGADGIVHNNEGNNHHKIEAYFLVKKVAFHELIPRLRDIALWAANRLPLLSLLISE